MLVAFHDAKPVQDVCRPMRYLDHMRIAIAATLAASLVAGSAHSQADRAFGSAAEAASNLDFAKARQLYAVAAAEDPDPKQRAQAALQLTNIEWRIFHDTAAAEKAAALIPEDSEEFANGWAQRARMAAELQHDYATAAARAQRAISVATRDIDRAQAILIHAEALIEPIRRAHLAGRCEGDVVTLQIASAELQAVIDRAGPLPQHTRELLDAALLAGDGPTALAAWRGYYGSTAESALLAPAAATLSRELPSWRGAAAEAAARRAVGLALADSRLFTSAVLVLRDPCAKSNPDASDPRVADVVAYEASLRTIVDTTNEYYRTVALQDSDAKAFRAALGEIGQALWPKLSWSGGAPPFSIDALNAELARRFGTVITLGTTSNVFDLHYAHSVIDEKRDVKQYGRSASLHFASLDGVASDGFSLWIHDGSGGDGGWANSVIYQLRPLYTMGPLLAWLQTADPKMKAQRDVMIAAEERQDDQRIARDPFQLPRGVAMRMERQYQLALLNDLRASGLSGDALRAAFIARNTRDVFESSIWAHEGRHAIDKKHLNLRGSPELEFRAKLSEVAFAPAPRHAATCIAADVPATSPHGKADRRIGEALVPWMKAHKAQIAGLDLTHPMLLQFDKLTDDQLRAAFRSMDPMAK